MEGGMEGGSRAFAKYKRQYLCDASAIQIGNSATQVSLNGEGTIVQTTPINISTTHWLTPTEKSHRSKLFYFADHDDDDEGRRGRTGRTD